MSIVFHSEAFTWRMRRRAAHEHHTLAFSHRHSSSALCTESPQIWNNTGRHCSSLSSMECCTHWTFPSEIQGYIIHFYPRMLDFTKKKCIASKCMNNLIAFWAYNWTKQIKMSSCSAESELQSRSGLITQQGSLHLHCFGSITWKMQYFKWSLANHL